MDQNKNTIFDLIFSNHILFDCYDPELIKYLKKYIFNSLEVFTHLLYFLEYNEDLSFLILNFVYTIAKKDLLSYESENKLCCTIL